MALIGFWQTPWVARLAWDRLRARMALEAAWNFWCLASERASASTQGPALDLPANQSGISTHVDACQLATAPSEVPDSIVTARPSGSARNLSVMRPASVKSSAS